MYRHNLKFTFKVGDSNKSTNGILYSSNNTDISGTDVSKLSKLIKNPKNYQILLILSSILGDTRGTLIYNGSTFLLCIGKELSITKIEDNVQPM